jgi:multiple sugar transport system substrate-binding protein
MIRRFMIVKNTSMYLLLVLLLTSGCLGRVNQSTSIRFMVFGDPAEYQAYQELVKSFHDAQGEVRVILTHIPSPSEYRTRLATEFAAGTPPDVTLMNYRRYANFAARGVLEPLGDYLDRSTLISREDFYPITLDAFTWQGALLCVPQNISSLVVYYNRDLFKQAGVPYPEEGWHWEEFLAAALALTLDADGDGRIDQYGLGVEPSLFRLSPFIWQNDAPIVNHPDFPSRLTMTRPPSLAAFQWFVDLRLVHGVVPDRIEEAALDSDSRFIAGSTAMYLNSRRGTPTYREITAFEWDVAPLPQGKVRADILHSDAYCMSKKTANKNAAWKFIEFANSNEGQSIIVRSGRTVPSLIKVAESDTFLESGIPPQSSRVFLETIPYLKLVPVISTWEEIERTASLEIERAFYGDISVEEAANLAFTRTEEYFLMGTFAVGR